MTAKLRALSFAALLALGAASSARAEDDPWPGLKSELFQSRTVTEDAAAIELEAPGRAEDAAIVPISVKLPAALGAVKSLTIVVDKNPAPVAAVFKFGPAAGSGDRTIATRLRFDNYSPLRVIVEKDDGTLVMASRFVKAAGGCSAPALKDADEALANLGKSQVKILAEPAGKPANGTAVVMVRHPNYSGMQMNQETGLFIPAKYVSEMTVERGGQRVFALEAGISISADPNIRFTFAGGDDNRITVVTKDSDGNVFTAQSQLNGT